MKCTLSTIYVIPINRRILYKRATNVLRIAQGTYSTVTQVPGVLKDAERTGRVGGTAQLNPTLRAPTRPDSIGNQKGLESELMSMSIHVDLAVK